MAHVSRTRRADWYGRGSTASDAAAPLFRPGPPATAPDLAAQLWDESATTDWLTDLAAASASDGDGLTAFDWAAPEEPFGPATGKDGI